MTIYNCHLIAQKPNLLITVIGFNIIINNDNYRYTRFPCIFYTIQLQIITFFLLTSTAHRGFSKGSTSLQSWYNNGKDKEIYNLYQVILALQGKLIRRGSPSHTFQTSLVKDDLRSFSFSKKYTRQGNV